MGISKCRTIIFLIQCILVLSVKSFNVIRSNNVDPVEYETNALQLNDNITHNGSIIVDPLPGNHSEIDSGSGICLFKEYDPVDVDLSAQYQEMNFDAKWISRKYFWLSDTFDFESRYQSHVRDAVQNQKMVRVFILPHSHNDPGWLNTYEQYFYLQTKNILENAVRKLTDLPQMTFVWSEITYLAKWWKEANVLLRDQFRHLVLEGRLEIATGGWVVPDEATPSLYTLLVELTEGQQWVKNNLNITSRYSWAIDPFGHSATHSHLLKESGIQGMVIQRLHYAWKHWLAEHKVEEFRWRPRWDLYGKEDIPCLSLPYDLYSIKHACGPEPQVCLKFDFRSIQFEYGENYGLMTPITRINVKSLAEEIVTQYHKTASLTRHNVVLVPLGDDFRYDRALEWDQQYTNYMRLFSYINANKNKYRMEIQFGTLHDYFQAVEQQLQKEENRHDNELAVGRPSLSGDFFPYGDVYVSGQPAYWTGFYGTRPYWKKFHRELENELRSAEILFTYANMLAKRSNAIVDLKILSYKYQDLIQARQEFALFAHHDGITGTSRSWTMDDYGDRLHTSLLKCISVQQQSLKIIYQKTVKKTLPLLLMKQWMRPKFEELPVQMPLEVFVEKDDYTTKVMLFNNLGWKRTELVKVLVKRPVVQVTDQKGAAVPSQINPYFLHEDSHYNGVSVSERIYELVFLANMEPLSTSIFKIKGASAESREEFNSKFAVVSCDSCEGLNETQFPIKEMKEDELLLENEENVVYMGTNGLIEGIYQKATNKSLRLHLSLGMYRPANRQSGAYLLKPILSPVFKFFQTNYSKPHLIHYSGPVMSQLISVYRDRYETIKINTTLINTIHIPENSTGAQGILLETWADFSRDYSNRAEVFMRFDTGINSTHEEISTPSSPDDDNSSDKKEYSSESSANNNTEVISTTKTNLVMYTDQNGFAVERRITVESLPYEANTYPVTTMAYIQEDKSLLRFSVLVDRTHGFCSLEEGLLETLIERKSLYDDGRGMSEGVTDSRPTVSTYILLVENLENKSSSDPFSRWQPTLHAHKASLRQNYPPNLFVFNEPNEEEEDGGVDPTISLISDALPENVHLLNFRTISEVKESNGSVSYQVRNEEGEVATNTALLNLQYLWEFGKDMRVEECNESSAQEAEQQLHLETGLEEMPEGDSNNVTETTDVGDVKDHVAPEVVLPKQTLHLTLLINYGNVSRVTETSLTGVLDEDDVVEAIESQKKRGSSLLKSYKLHFG